MMPLERWRNTIDTNVTASFIVAKEYVRRLQDASVTVKDNASVIIIGSTAGKYGLLKPSWILAGYVTYVEL
jgi:NAD(P)-dependent dehydrogenase (short-subunit alcohol dehydrogenase family)